MLFLIQQEAIPHYKIIQLIHQILLFNKVFFVIINQSLFYIEKIIAIQLINILKLMRNTYITVLEFNPKYIQINKNLQIKLTNLQAYFLNNKNLKIQIIKSLQINKYIAPQLQQYIKQLKQSYNNENQYQSEDIIINQKFTTTDIYSLGIIFKKIFLQNKELLQYGEISNNRTIQGNQINSIYSMIQLMLSKDVNKRPDLYFIENVLLESKVLNKRQKIKISTNNLNVSPIKVQMTTSTSKLLISRQTSKKDILLSPLVNQIESRSAKSYQRKSSAQNIDSSPSNLRLSKRKCSILTSQKQPINSDILNRIILKIIKRRNLCKLQLDIARVLMQIKFIDYSLLISLAFLLIKKSVILICQLARFLLTGKGQIQSLTFKQSLRKQFIKTQDYTILQATIKNQMNLARQMFVSIGNLIHKQNLRQFQNSNQFNFKSQFTSQSIKDQTIRFMVKKIILEIMTKINIAHKPNQHLKRRKSSKSFDNTSSQQILLTTSTNKLMASTKQYNFLQIEDHNVSLRSPNTLKVLSSKSTGLQIIRIQTYDKYIVQKFLNHKQIDYLNLMSLIIETQTYQKVFEKMVDDYQIKLENIELIQKFKKMPIQDLAFSLQQLVLQKK